MIDTVGGDLVLHRFGGRGTGQTRAMVEDAKALSLTRIPSTLDGGEGLQSKIPMFRGRK
jgi:hypothetical protein